MAEEYLLLDDIITDMGGALLPLGERFPATIINMEGKLTKNGIPMFVMTYEVTSGHYKGMTHDHTFWVQIKTSKKGRDYSIGLSELKGMATVLGVVDKFPKQFSKTNLDVAQLKKDMHKVFGKAKFEFTLSKEDYQKNDGTLGTKKITSIFPVGRPQATTQDHESAETEIVY